MSEPVPAAQEIESFAILEEIAATIQHYVDGARAADSGLIRLAFTETARICGSYRGKAVEWSVQECCSIMEKGGRAENLEARVVGIEYAGNAGMARLEACNWRGTRYTDFFVLVKQANVWRISSKAFFAHSRA